MSGVCADPVYPPSLYRAVSYASTLGVPVYILENGMPCREDDDRRKEWIDGCLAEVHSSLSCCLHLLPLHLATSFLCDWQSCMPAYTP